MADRRITFPAKTHAQFSAERLSIDETQASIYLEIQVGHSLVCEPIGGSRKHRSTFLCSIECQCDIRPNFVLKEGVPRAYKVLFITPLSDTKAQITVYEMTGKVFVANVPTMRRVIELFHWSHLYRLGLDNFQFNRIYPA